MLIEQFTDRTPISIEQDFYATMFLTNLVAFAKMESDMSIKHADSEKSLKYKHKTNEKMLIGLLKDKLILMLLCPDPNQRQRIFDGVIAEASRFKTEVRPGRHFDRPKDAHHRRRIRRKSVI